MAMPAVEGLERWDVTAGEAQSIQNRLRRQVRVEPLDAAAVRTAAGADVSFETRSKVAHAGFVVLRLPEMSVAERAGVRAEVTFPYIPGLLSFRETPPLLEAWRRLRDSPDALVCDAHGLAHPRRFGLACHLGLLLDVPTVGCAKSVLVGTHEAVGDAAGDWAPLVDGDEVIGAALRTRPGVAPVYVSIGYRCDLPSAIALTMRCVGATRLPETTRLAHEYVNRLRRGATL